jgi:hypothetical protein
MSWFSSLNFTQIWPSVPDQSELRIQLQPISTHGSDQSQIMVQFITSKNASSQITTSKNASYFDIKGGLLTPFQPHPIRKNLPAPPSHSPLIHHISQNSPQPL